MKDPNILLSFADSMPYINDDHAWCIQRASQSASWENIFQVFTYDMWLAILVSFLLMSMLIYAFARFEHLKFNVAWILLRSLALSISAPPFLWPTPHFSIRLIFFVFLTYGVIINIAFSSFLVNALTKQRFTRQIKTINETIQQRFVYVGGPVVYDSLASRGDPVGVLGLSFLLVLNSVSSFMSLISMNSPFYCRYLGRFVAVLLYAIT